MLSALSLSGVSSGIGGGLETEAGTPGQAVADKERELNPVLFTI